MAAVRTVDAVWARHVARLMDARGKSSEAILADLGLDRAEVMRTDSRIPFAKHAALLEAAAKELDDPCFGLHFGARIYPLESGLIGYAAASAATVGEAVAVLARYGRVFTEGARLTVGIGDWQALLTMDVIDPEVRQLRQLQEFGLSILVNFLRTLSIRRVSPLQVEFRHQRRDGIEEFEDYFGCQVLFGRSRNAIVVDRGVLALTCRAADERLLGILKAYCEETLEKRLHSEDFKLEMEHLIASLLPSGSVTAHSVARQLAMSERTLARRLSERGLSFRELLDEVRRDLAFKYLDDGPEQLSQVAYLLGYSEPSAFNHAFRRWTGTSPTEFKAGAG